VESVLGRGVRSRTTVDGIFFLRLGGRDSTAAMYPLVSFFGTPLGRGRELAHALAADQQPILAELGVSAPCGHEVATQRGPVGRRPAFNDRAGESVDSGSRLVFRVRCGLPIQNPTDLFGLGTLATPRSAHGGTCASAQIGKAHDVV
jgi:hypothetical protein